MVRYKTKKDLEYLRISGKILAEVLLSLKNEVGIGVPLNFLDKKAYALMESKGGKPAFLGYISEQGGKPYPASICTSVNDEIVHGIPSSYELKMGDVLKIDAGVDYEGYITDSALTVVIGKPSKKIAKLISITEEALYDGISVSRPGNYLGDIGNAIEKRVKKSGFKIIRGLTGHGTGFKLHEDPTVWNFGQKGEGLLLREGLVIALEPMVSIGTEDSIEKNNGTFVTNDGSIAAHFEHTICITKNGCEILTK